jgi:hypothetical protein
MNWLMIRCCDGLSRAPTSIRRLAALTRQRSFGAISRWTIVRPNAELVVRSSLREAPPTPRPE